MPSKVILFTGAPHPSTVNETSCTLTNFDTNFTTFPHPHDQSKQGSSAPATWRYLPLSHQPLHTGLTQTHHNESFSRDSDFFTTADITFEDDSFHDEDAKGIDLLTQFCNHSLAVHNPLPSSQLSQDPSSNDETSFITTSSTSSALPISLPVAHLSDLEDIPPAPKILSLQPQTPTINIIAGVISVAQPRIVSTRWGTRLSLVEVLVGDETRSGFGITFWLSKTSDHQVTELRRQDVVLMQNVALHVFRGKVYGQSLRRGLTRLSLLWRRDGSGHYKGRMLDRGKVGDPQREKTRLVKDYMLKFVGGPEVYGRTRSSRKSWDRPPKDTQ